MIRTRSGPKATVSPSRMTAARPSSVSARGELAAAKAQRAITAARRIGVFIAGRLRRVRKRQLKYRGSKNP
jgi:hypothetical protein